MLNDILWESSRTFSHEDYQKILDIINVQSPKSC